MEQIITIKKEQQLVCHGPSMGSYSIFTALRNILLIPYFIAQKAKAQEGCVACPWPHR